MINDKLKKLAAEKARQIISLAIQRFAGSHTSDMTTATIALPDVPNVATASLNAGLMCGGSALLSNLAK